MTIEEAICMEFDCERFLISVRNENFEIGVDHLLNKKLKTRPPWSPSSIHEISTDEVSAAFENNSGVVMRLEN